jgi:uncharacterized membrane protein YdbT with pleckstrin-like domain
MRKNMYDQIDPPKEEEEQQHGDNQQDEQQQEHDEQQQDRQQGAQQHAARAVNQALHPSCIHWQRLCIACWCSTAMHHFVSALHACLRMLPYNRIGSRIVFVCWRWLADLAAVVHVLWQVLVASVALMTLTMMSCWQCRQRQQW